MNPSSSSVLLVRQTDAVAWFTLNRPEKYNALSVGLNQALIEACRSVAPGVAMVVLQGAGRHFCVGSDLHEIYRVDRAEAARVIKLEIDACQALAALPQLTIALLHGKCLGGGAILPLYCDLRVARAGVEFSLPEVALGWAPPYGIERMEANLHRSFALDMLLSGRTCGDREAREEGWVHRLFGADPGEETAYFEPLARRPPRVLKDVVGLLPKDLRGIRTADEKAMATFLEHFDTEAARRQVAEFVERKRR